MESAINLPAGDGEALIHLCPRCFAPLPAHSVTPVCIGCPARVAATPAFPVFTPPERGTAVPSLLDQRIQPIVVLDTLD